MKLNELTGLFDCEIVGDSGVEIKGASGISEAKDGDITFLSDKRWLKDVKESKASAVIVKDIIEGLQKPQVKTGNPQYAFAKLLSLFYIKPRPDVGIGKNAFVSENSSIGQNVSIYDFAYISDGVRIGAESVVFPGVFIGENSVIGEACVIHPSVTIRENVSIGNRVIIHSGSVIGSDGFGYVYEDNMHQKIPQVGGVIIEDDVEIGAGVTIDRATTGNTIVGGGTKIDNLVQIGHNVRIGRNVILVAQVGIAGSSRIGDGVILGGQAGVADHTNIESGTMVAAKGGAMGDVKRGIYSGAPMIPHRDWLKSTALFTRLPELKRKIEELERKIKSLEKENREGK